MPTVNDSQQFVKGKVNRIITQNECLQEFVKESDTIDMKQVGDNTIYYRGTWVDKAALMITSDLNVYDEVDRSKQSVVEQYASRLQHSEYQWEWFFSNPSTPGNGVGKLYELSDQKHFFYKCTHCSKEQYLRWPESIDLNRKIFVCLGCNKELIRKGGRWLPKYKGREISGYWISLLMAPWVSAETIINFHKTKSEQYFYNFVLGLPYEGGGTVVTDKDILQNAISQNLYPNDENNDRIVIGVDTGTQIYYTVGGDQGIFYYGQCDDYEPIEALMKRFKRAIVVMDAGGDLILPRKLRKKYPGRVYLCHYAADRKTMQLIRWGEKDELGNVIADRNRMISFVIEEFQNKLIPLQGKESDWHEFLQHFKNIEKIITTGETGEQKFEWIRHGADHWVHSTVYWRIGMDRFGTAKATIFKNNVDAPKPGVEIVDGRIPLIYPSREKPVDWRNA